MKESIKNCIDNLKHLPGVYLMHNKDDQIIYVGKAKDLYKRVSQYFLRPQIGKVDKMAKEAEYFETIITANEKEALVLEMNLIHKHYPKYNIMLKDNSHYPYIALTKKGDPFLSIKRSNKDNKYVYFGPYPNSSAAFEMIDLLNKVFPIRKCKNMQSSTCLYYHLGQCLAPCVNKIDEQTFQSLREGIKSFMNGQNQSVCSEIKKKMIKASEDLDFETAGYYKKILDSIEHINAQQNVELSDKKDRDIFAFSSRDGYLSISILTISKGAILGKESHVIESFSDEETQVSELIEQYYETHSLPYEVVINNHNVVENIKETIETRITSVTKGRLLELVISAKENADNELDKYFLSSRLDEDKLAMLEELGTLLNIPTPLHIELFDNSHLQGSSPVGAMVAFVNGEPQKSLYRKFKIEHLEARDDLSSMKEVIFRHYSRLMDENKKLPDLILVDGGINQVKAALLSLERCNAEIPIFGLYKDDKHRTSGLIDYKENIYPIENKKLFFLLTRMQDEVHRFAISFHQQKRSKAMVTSIFDDVKGLGDKGKEKLTRAYNDISLLKQATVSELEQILPHDVAINLYNKLHS